MKKHKPKREPSKPRTDGWTMVPIGGSSKRPFTENNSDLQRRIASNPLSVAAEAQSKIFNIQQGYRRELHEALAMIVGIAAHFLYDYKAWRQFFGTSFFHVAGRKAKARTQHKNALRHTLNYVFNATSKQSRSRTGKYAAALHEMVITGVPVHCVVEEIERAGGIEKLYEAYLEREAQKAKKGRKPPMIKEEHDAAELYYNVGGKEASEAPDLMPGDLEGGALAAEDDWDEGDRADGESGADSDDLDSPSDAEIELASIGRRGLDPMGRRTVELEVTGERQLRFLDMPEGKYAVLLVKFCGTEGGWQRIRVKKAVWSRKTI